MNCQNASHPLATTIKSLGFYYYYLSHIYYGGGNHITIIYLFKGIVRSRTNADFSSTTTNVHLSVTSWTQYGYSGHVINLYSFVNSLPHLPSDLDIVIIRKEGSNNHHDFCVQRSKVFTGLQWLVSNKQHMFQ